MLKIPTADKIVLERLEKEFQCPACANILCSTVITGCGIKICRFCLVTWLKDHEGQCPIYQEVKCCGKFKPAPRIDAKIQSEFRKVSHGLRDERNVFITYRELLLKRFDLENGTVSGDKTPKWKCLQDEESETMKWKKPCPTEKASSSKKFLGGRSSSISFPGSKSVGRKDAASKMAKTTISQTAAPTIANLAAANAANDLLVNSLNSRYEHYLTDAERCAQEERSFLGLGAGGDRPGQLAHFHNGNLVEIPNSHPAAAAVPQGLVQPRIQTSDLLQRIVHLKNYLKDTAFEVMTQEFIQNNSEDHASKYVGSMLQNAVEIQRFLERRLEIQRNEGTHDEEQMHRLMRQMADLLKVKSSAYAMLNQSRHRKSRK